MWCHSNVAFRVHRTTALVEKLGFYRIWTALDPMIALNLFLSLVNPNLSLSDGEKSVY